MEDLCLKFPHLSEQIFDSLDNESIVKSREARRSWRLYLNDNEKFIQIRIIKATVGHFHQVGEAWERAFATANAKTIHDLGAAVHLFYQKNNGLTYYEGLTPSHVAAGTY